MIDDLIKCVNCVYFSPTIGDDGTCHVRPPTHEGFGTTTRDQWCQGWKPNVRAIEVITERQQKLAPPTPQASQVVVETPSTQLERDISSAMDDADGK